ncbi:MAG: hypothetical protein H6625_10735 [Bdellovibrionaceae bacterium]|nr:hypothetical protein [Pseudobdellovibrionaceae bacterium]
MKKFTVLIAMFGFLGVASAETFLGKMGKDTEVKVSFDPQDVGAFLQVGDLKMEGLRRGNKVYASVFIKGQKHTEYEVLLAPDFRVDTLFGKIVYWFSVPHAGSIGCKSENDLIISINRDYSCVSVK